MTSPAPNATVSPSWAPVDDAAGLAGDVGNSAPLLVLTFTHRCYVLNLVLVLVLVLVLFVLYQVPGDQNTGNPQSSGFWIGAIFPPLELQQAF